MRTLSLSGQSVFLRKEKKQKESAILLGDGFGGREMRTFSLSGKSAFLRKEAKEKRYFVG